MEQGTQPGPVITQNYLRCLGMGSVTSCVIPRKEHNKNIHLGDNPLIELIKNPIPPRYAPSVLSLDRFRRYEARLFERPPTDRLFFAALPDAATAARISDLASRLKIGHGLSGRTLRPEHLHVTLVHLGDSDGLCQERVQSATERASSVCMPSFKVIFDRVGSFKNGAFVLRGEEGTIGLEVLQQRLSDTLDSRPARARPFTPHVMLLRDSQKVEEHDIQPIEWTVKEVVLVHSLLGKTEHRPLARFALG